jgi:spore germination protein GerM
VHWLIAGETVVPRVREVSGSTRRERLADLLDQLAAGPSQAERDEQLSSALPPEAQLSVTALDDSTATIDLDPSGQAPVGVSSRRAVAQIVLTATSSPGVRSVLLELGGQPVEAPLPSGELTSRPLTAADYAAATVPPSATVTPEPAPGPPAATPAPAAPS